MGIFTQRWLVLYETSEGRPQFDAKPAAKIIVDAECKYPHGVIEEDIAEDCYRILAFVALPDDYEPNPVVMNDQEVPVQLPKEDDEE
jgi:hypothetical protein